MKLSKDYQYQILCEEVQMRGFILSFLGRRVSNSRRFGFAIIPVVKVVVRLL